MTNLGTIILIIVCSIMGYAMEPMFFSGTDMTKKKPAEKVDANEEVPADAVVSPTTTAVDPAVEKPAPTPAIQIDLSKITPADFPAKVDLKVDYTIADANSGVTMQLKKGSKVKPLRIEGSDLIIQPVGLPIESKIDVDQTNFKELALPNMINRLQNTVADKSPDPLPPVERADSPVETPPTPPSPAGKLDEAAIVSLLKADVEAGKVTEFKANQVTQWNAGEEIDFDGETYQTGLVTFKAETILGVQEHEAIALIEDGKVYKWMWAKTKLEMR